MLEPLVRAGMEGLRKSKWQLGWPVEYLVVPIVIAVVIEVSRQLGLKEHDDV